MPGTDQPSGSESRFRSGLERRAAAAGARDVRIAELEPGAVGAFDVVDLRSVQVLVAEGIDEQLYAVSFEQLVEIRGFVLEVQVVLETGAATTDHAEAEALTFEAFRPGDLFNFVCGQRCD